MDEFISIQRSDASSDAFRAIVADPQAALSLLSTDPTHPFDDELWSKKFFPHTPMTAGDLAATYGPFQAAYAVEIAIAESALTAQYGAVELVHVPVFYACLGEDVSGTPNGTEAISALPNTVNLLDVNNTLIVADPMYAPFRDSFTTSVGGTIAWIDCLEYHWKAGAVHCGTNVVRQPRESVRHWWTVQP